MDCNLCARQCGADRAAGLTGFCGMGEDAFLARAMLHKWEEPCISGARGSGTVFFSGCSLRCAYCQNWEISHMRKGIAVSVERMRQIFQELIAQGAHNINLVNPTHFVPAIARALEGGLPVPVVYNTHGYDSLDALRRMEGKADVYLTDLKYASSLAARRYSGVRDYFERAQEAIAEMFRQCGPAQFDADGLMTRGVIIRHLILPGQAESAKRVIDYVAEHYPQGVLFSLMSQYVPCGQAYNYPEIDRRLTEAEYAEVEQYLFDSGLEDGFVQEMEAADAGYVPDFNLQGVLTQEDMEELRKRQEGA